MSKPLKTVSYVYPREQSDEHETNVRSITVPELLDRLEHTIDVLLLVKERLIANQEFDTALVARNTIDSNRIAITKAKGG